MTTETKGLREERMKLINEARALIEVAEKESRDMNEEEQGKYDTVFADADSLKKRIDRLEDQARIEAEHIKDADPVEGEETSSEKITRQAMDLVVTKQFNHGYDSLDKPQRKILDHYKKEEKVFWKNLQEGYSSLDADEKKIFAENIKTRQQSVGTNSAGGFLVPKQFQLELDKALLEFGGMREAARVIRSDKGGTLDWPTVDDTNNKGRFLAENAAVVDKDIVFGQVQFNDFIASSDMIKVPFTLMTDSAFDMPSFLREELATRIGRLTNEAYTTGSGSSKPKGVTKDTKLGKTAALSTALTAEELIDTFHSVDVAYRRNEKAWWMFTDLTMKAIRKLKDSDGQFIWQPGLRAGEPDILLGKRFIINNDMAEIGKDNISVLFGDFNKYIIRDIGGFILLRLDERFADNLQVGFTGFLRTDGKLIDAGTGPIKHLRHPNT